MSGFQTLRDFQYVDRDGRDQGANVREKARQLVCLLKDEDRLRQERSQALKTKERMAGGGTGGGNGGGGGTGGSGGGSGGVYGGIPPSYHPGRRTSQPSMAVLYGEEFNRSRGSPCSFNCEFDFKLIWTTEPFFVFCFSHLLNILFRLLPSLIKRFSNHGPGLFSQTSFLYILFLSISSSTFCEGIFKRFIISCFLTTYLQPFLQNPSSFYCHDHKIFKRSTYPLCSVPLCICSSPCLNMSVPSAASASSPRAASDLEQARPQTSGEEELQLQLALAMSREESQKVRRQRG